MRECGRWSGRFPDSKMFGRKIKAEVLVLKRAETE